jgi:hypothetical protein
MRKCYLLLFIVITGYSLYSQSPVVKVAHNYFRSDPFETEFSSFLKHLLNDPTIKDKILEKKTDTSLFFFQGVYTSHNPFFFKPAKVEVSLGETVIKLDSLRSDTVYTYQLLACNNSTEKGIQEVKKEFEKIYRRYKSAFKSSSYAENSPESKMAAASYNFFDGLHGISPFAITWLGPSEDKEICLVITIRMKARNNKATLPLPLYPSQYRFILLR